MTPAERASYYKAAFAHPVVFINLFGWTYDPRESPAFLPFELFERQAEYILWMKERYEKRESGLADKCRDVGFTWLSISVLTWLWLTREGFKGTVGSRKLELVDKMGNMDAILPKIRFLIDWLPDDITPRYDPKFCNIVNLDNGAAITGEGGDQMGRGGRSSMYLKDEAAFIERPQLVDAAVSGNSDVVIEVSTPNGIGVPFATRRFSGVFPVFTFSWQDDPRKDQQWFERKKRELDPIVFAQEVLIDYTASQPGILLPRAWLMECVDRTDIVPSGGLVIVGYDVADEGSNLNVCVARQGNKVIGVEAWHGQNLTDSAFRSIDFARRMQAHQLNFDAVGVGSATGEIYKTTAKGAMGDLRWYAVKSGNAPTGVYVPSERRRSTDKFINLRAELGWMLRERVWRTYASKSEGAVFPDSEKIVLPRNERLLFDLGVVTYKFKETGKLALESKENMAKQGIKSPDYYDALALTMYGGATPLAPATASW